MKYFLLMSLLVSCVLHAEELEISKGMFRASYERVAISENEDMGLVGISYLFTPHENFYYGMSMYGTLTGERGGFFVGGFNAGLKYPIYKNISLDMGVFVGGGGGGSAPQGGGLMLKSYGGALYEFKNYGLGLHYSYITFPNGDIDSTQVSVVADMHFETLFVDEILNVDLLKKYSFSNQNDYIVATAQIYFPEEGTKKVDTITPLDQNIKLAGVEYGWNISEDFVAYVESAGALGGDSTGYMELLGGLAYSKNVSKNFTLGARISLGSAGGGQVNTGGGAVSKSSLFMNYKPTHSITAGLGIGYFHAFEGNFDAPIAKLQVGMDTNFLTLSQGKQSKFFDSFDTQKFTLRLAHQTYLYSDNLSPRDDGEPIDLMGGKIDWYMSKSFYITGQAFAAYKGGAGGYATGQFGLGYHQNLLYDFSLVAEANLGAAGGGSLQTGAGAVLQPMIGLEYSINDTISFQALVGKIVSIDGELDTQVIDFSFVYRFDKLVQK